MFLIYFIVNYIYKKKENAVMAVPKCGVLSVNTEQIDLKTLGWTEQFAAAFQQNALPGCAPARVTRIYNRFYELHGEHRQWLAELAGKFKHGASGGEALPAVGDWVCVEPLPDPERGIIHSVLPRSSRFLRKTPGALSDVQVIAANIDILFILMGLDNDYNPRRLERYLVLARESGATPVVVLNKTDLVSGEILDLQREDVAIAAAPAPVIELSALLGNGCRQICELLPPGKTGALVGSSGTGKSTLINRLIGSEIQKTGELRDDFKGRHTTTARELFILPGGQLLIDTPGMRELQLWVNRDELLQGFPEIAEAATTCKFRDCRHINEPGCAVLAALEEGTIDSERYTHFLKLDRELAQLERRRTDYRRSGKQARKKHRRR